jgi:hypothetical protein
VFNRHYSNSLRLGHSLHTFLVLKSQRLTLVSLPTLLLPQQSLEVTAVLDVVAVTTAGQLQRRVNVVTIVDTRFNKAVQVWAKV